MKYRLLILVSGSVLALGACKQNSTNNVSAESTNNYSTESTNNVSTESTNNTAAQAPLTSQNFVNAAAASDKFEIESSKLAATQASSSSVKSFATKMISAHSASTAKLKSTVAGMSPPMTPDDTLSADQQSTLDNLKTLKGADFDKAYASAQVDAHQKALDALNGYASSGDNAKLKDFASGLVPTVTAHLNMAKALK